MKVGPKKTAATLSAVGLLLLLSLLVSPAAASSGPSYPNTSWALGLVVPQGAQLSGGGSVQWQSVKNVTAMMTLPDITFPDRVVYTVLSVMTSDGGVLQVAAGVYPNRTTWLAYSWAISNVESPPLTYYWVLNASGPQMAPGARIVASIFLEAGTWYLRVVDLDTGSSASDPFPTGVAPSLRVGDQEVFALESYSRAGFTFRDMGNLTLWSLMINGQKVTGGTYSYSQWDPSHNPVFVVGSSGSGPPNFLSFERTSDGSFVWGYERGWTNDVYVYPNMIGATMVIGLIVGVFSILGVIVLMTRRKAGSLPSSENRLIRLNDLA